MALSAVKLLIFGLGRATLVSGKTQRSVYFGSIGMSVTLRNSMAGPSAWKPILPGDRKTTGDVLEFSVDPDADRSTIEDDLNGVELADRLFGRRRHFGKQFIGRPLLVAAAS